MRETWSGQSPGRWPGIRPRNSTRTEARPATIAHPHLATCVAPAAALLAGAAGQLLLQHRPALALIPVAVLRAVVVAAAGDGVVAVAAAPATAPAATPSASFGEFGAAAVADPHRAIAHPQVRPSSQGLPDSWRTRRALRQPTGQLRSRLFWLSQRMVSPGRPLPPPQPPRASTNSARQPLLTQMLPLRLPQVRPSSQALPDSWRTSCALRQPVLHTRSRLFWLSQRITPLCAAAGAEGRASVAMVPRLRVTARLARDSGFMAASHTVAGA